MLTARFSHFDPNRSSNCAYQHFLLVGILVVLPGLAYAENAGPPPVPPFEPTPCPKLPGADELTKANCGYLVVPENRSRPSGRTIRLMVAKYPARSPEKRADPIVYLAGGPGDIAPLDVNGLIAADFIRDRDIVVMSQRGTMFSEPARYSAPTPPGRRAARQRSQTSADR